MVSPQTVPLDGDTTFRELDRPALSVATTVTENGVSRGAPMYSDSELEEEPEDSLDHHTATSSAESVEQREVFGRHRKDSVFSVASVHTT